MPALKSPTTVELIEETEETTRSSLWCVILYNDNAHSFDEVILQVQKATRITLKDAFEITLEAHTMGKAVCFKGTRIDCEKVAGILRQIQLQVEIQLSLETG